MMKNKLLIIFFITLAACHQPADHLRQLQSEIDSLKNKLNNAYKPGFGEFMSSIQVHHAKLWFAGENENWKLADFEMHEIMESLDAIHKYQAERKESEKIPMLNPAIDSVNAAIKQQNLSLFKSSYTLFTNTCNNCHRATNHEFNVVKVPDAPPLSNQDFKKGK